VRWRQIRLDLRNRRADFRDLPYHPAHRRYVVDTTVHQESAREIAAAPPQRFVIFAGVRSHRNMQRPMAKDWLANFAAFDDLSGSDKCSFVAPIFGDHPR